VYWGLRVALTEHERATGRGGRGGRGKGRGARDATERARISGLRDELTAHPCHGCPDLAAHEEQQRTADRTGGEAARLRASVERRTGSLVRRFHQLTEVLVRRGYLAADGQDRRLTASGRVLAGIYADVDLLVAELVTRGTFDARGPAELAGLAALLVHQARRDDVAVPERLPTPALDRAAEDIAAVADDLRSTETSVGIEPLRDLDPGFVAPAVRWASGASLEEAVADLELSGGDFVRTIKQVVDLLGQLRDVSDGSRRSALDEAVRALRRGIVDA
jgi:ATP-dependent RNA helicase HelY